MQTHTGHISQLMRTHLCFDDPPPESLTGFFLSLARYVFSFSARSRYDTHFALIDSFALSLCASSNKKSYTTASKFSVTFTIADTDRFLDISY